jgi:hypothetical protein
MHLEQKNMYQQQHENEGVTKERESTTLNT